MKLPAVISARRRGLFLLLISNGFLQALCTVGITLLIKATFDTYLTGSIEPVIGLWQSAAALFCAALAIAWLKYRERLDAERAGQDYVHELRMKMFSRYCNADLSELERHGKGAVSLRFATDLSALRLWISQGLSRLVVAGINLVIALGALSMINLTLGISVFAIIVLTAIASVLSGKSLRERFYEARRQRSYLANNINEKLGAMSTIKVSGQRKREKNRVRRQSERVMEAMLERAAAIGLLRAITEGSTLLATGTVLIIGVYLMQAGDATPGTVVGALGVVSLLMQPVRNLGRVHEYHLNASVAEERIRGFLSKRPSTLSRQRSERSGDGNLLLDRVSCFPRTQRVTIDATAGTSIALLGHNGAGKSTLLAQIAGLLKPARGRILLGDNNVSKLKDAAMRNSIGMVSPTLPLLKGSLRKNISYRCPDADEADLERVIALCGLGAMIDKLPEGLDTRIRENGNDLSQGERQRIALARAMLGEPEVLLLDEADAFLDENGLMLFKRIVSGYPGLVIMATHDVEHVKYAEQVWVMERGEISWHGSRDEFDQETYSNRLKQSQKLNSGGTRRHA